MAGAMHDQEFAILATVENRPGALYELTKVLAAHQADIGEIEIVRWKPGEAQVYLEFTGVEDADALIEELRRLSLVRSVEATSPFSNLYGKRIVIMGGGAQVGQVAMGAIAEADRHNIRGERISVDTIPLVGEQALAGAIRSIVRLPRVRLLVLAGSLMGGDIATAVKEIRQQGLVVISLNMAGGAPEAADLVVTDPVQAGVMAVMAVAETAKFDIVRQQKRHY